jgi:acetoin utilization deacetylase AcuC-like enzyme
MTDCEKVAVKDEKSDIDKAWCYYDKVNKALTGLFEILTLNFDEDNIYYQCGVDNLEQLKDTIMDLLKHDYNPVEIKIKLRDLEFNMKKCLFFEDERKEGQEQGL